MLRTFFSARMLTVHLEPLLLMKQKTIVGKMAYVNLETGFWCITDRRNQIWRIVGPVPASLQQNGLNVRAVVAPQEEFASVFMSGKPVALISFELL